jgi:uncharacterized membrane protein YozB (DUF420 family)
MNLDKKSFLKKALIIVAISYLLYNIYQAIVTTIFVSHFPLIITQLPNFIESSQPALQLWLFLLQELIGSIGIYLRLVAGVFAVYAAFLFMKKDKRYLKKFSKVLLFESLYFALLIPAGINHIVGSIISYSLLLNVYTGLSFLLQAVLIFPPLLMLSHRLGKSQDHSSLLNWAGAVMALYIFGLWIKHGLMWVYALSPSAPQQAGLIDTIGSVNSLLTLLMAAIITTGVWLISRQKKKPNKQLMGASLILVGVYFVIYAIVAVWVSIYFSFMTLTEFWMITLPILGVALLLNSENNIN